MNTNDGKLAPKSIHKPVQKQSGMALQNAAQVKVQHGKKGKAQQKTEGKQQTSISINQ